MHDDIFQGANNVFCGKLRCNKQDGNDVSEPRSDILPDEKLYYDYFTPGLEGALTYRHTEVLLHKVFFDLMYHTGRRAKEGFLKSDQIFLRHQESQ